MFFNTSAVLEKLLSSWKNVHHHGILLHLSCKHFIHLIMALSHFCINHLKSSHSFRLTHNWWHVALCFLEGNAPMQRVLDVYDNYIWKELEKPDAAVPEAHNFINFVTYY